MEGTQKMNKKWKPIHCFEIVAMKFKVETIEVSLDKKITMLTKKKVVCGHQIWSNPVSFYLQKAGNQIFWLGLVIWLTNDW